MDSNPTHRSTRLKTTTSASNGWAARLQERIAAHAPQRPLPATPSAASPRALSATPTRVAVPAPRAAVA